MMFTNRPISFIGASWDAQSTEQAIVPEIQVNDEETVVCSDIHRSVELKNVMSDDDDKEET